MAWNPPSHELQDVVQQLGTGTKAVSIKYKHEGPISRPVVMPTYQSTTYYVDSCEKYFEQNFDGFVYSRLKTPTTQELECTISALENAAGSVVFPSGMSAVTSVLMAFLKAGDHVVAQNPCYSGTYIVFKDYLPKYNIEVTFVPAGCEVDEYERAIKPNTKLVYGETPCNPLMTILDVVQFAELGKRHPGLITFVDGTFATPINQRPLDYGIDVSLHSCTKYLGGHCDLLAGCASVRTKELYTELKRFQVFFGTCVGASDASLLLRSLKSLHVRVRQHNENAAALARFFEGHPKIVRVHYPGLPSHPHHERAKKFMTGGYGGMLGVELATSEAARVFVESLKIMRLAVSLGGVETLVEHVGLMTHGSWVMTDAEREKGGIAPGLVRVSVGIEDVADLIRDAQAALDKVSA